jgi:hypothetical protein
MHNKYSSLPENAGRDSAVGIATCYVLDGSGIECRCGEIQVSVPGVDPTSYTMRTQLFPAVGQSKRGINHPILLEARLKKE